MRPPSISTYVPVPTDLTSSSSLVDKGVTKGRVYSFIASATTPLIRFHSTASIEILQFLFFNRSNRREANFSISFLRYAMTR